VQAHLVAVSAVAAPALGAGPSRAQQEEHESWCADGDHTNISFQLDHGKTLSICSRYDNEVEVSTHTRCFGRLGFEPELRYAGGVLASLGGPSFHSEGSGAGVLSDLPGMAEDGETRALVVELSDAPNTDGFIALHGLTGYSSSSCHIVWNGGWRYDACRVAGRTTNAQAGTEECEQLAAYAEYWPTL